jgi:hypothetical protein
LNTANPTESIHYERKPGIGGDTADDGVRIQLSGG